MSRPRQYTPLRKLLMQAAMWLIFAASLGLAGLVTRERLSGLAKPVGLSGAYRCDALRVRTPASWKITTTRVGGRTVLAASEYDGHHHPTGRVLTITQESADADTSAENYLASQVGTISDPMPCDFAGLGVTGVLTQIPEEGEPLPQDIDVQTGLFACAIVPTKTGDTLAVMVGLASQPPFRTDDRTLLREVVDHLTLAPENRMEHD